MVVDSIILRIGSYRPRGDGIQEERTVLLATDTAIANGMAITPSPM